MESLSNSTIGYNRGELLEEWHSPGYIEKEDQMEMDSTDINLSSLSTVSSIPKPAPNFPARGHSEPITHHHNVNAQVGELLEDWPRRMSCCSADTEGWKSQCKQLPPKVTFSERSSMLVYCLDPLYVRNKSYTKTDRKNFGSKALSEAIRIERLILTTPGASTKDSFNCLLKNDIISLAEIVGIEHLVLGKSKAKKLLTERQDHSREVLMEQRRQRHVEKMQYDHIEKLGEFSASRSVKSAKRARIRAAVAA